MPSFKQQSIFPYHHIVRNDKVPHIENLYAYKNEAQFRNDLDFLIKNYNQISPFELQENPSAKGVFLLTFDDGLEEIYSVVFPILREKNVKAVFFINPDFVDNRNSLYKHDISIIIGYVKKHGFRADVLSKITDVFPIKYDSNKSFITEFKKIKFTNRHKIKIVLDSLGIDIEEYLQNSKPYISKSQIKEMIDAGFWFAGHTMSHPPLNQLSHEKQKAEIIGSIEWLKANFQITYSMFAFPFTDKTASKKLIAELFEYDEKLLLFGNSGLKQDIDPRIIQRFSIENPKKNISKLVVSENLYKKFNQLIGKYRIHRK